MFFSKFVWYLYPLEISPLASFVYKFVFLPLISILSSSFDNISVQGVSYLTLEEAFQDNYDDVPFANQSDFSATLH